MSKATKLFTNFCSCLYAGSLADVLTNLFPIQANTYCTQALTVSNQDFCLLGLAVTVLKPSRLCTSSLAKAIDTNLANASEPLRLSPNKYLNFWCVAARSFDVAVVQSPS